MHRLTAKSGVCKLQLTATSNHVILFPPTVVGGVCPSLRDVVEYSCVSENGSSFIFI